MSNSYQEITDVVQVYFDGLYECNTEKLATIFHPSAHLFANMDGEFVDWPREEWFEIVKTRVPPATTGNLPGPHIHGPHPLRPLHSPKQMSGNRCPFPPDT